MISGNLWKSYVDVLSSKVPNVIQFCDRGELTPDKKASLAAAIIFNTAFIGRGISNPCAPMGGGYCFVVKISKLYKTKAVEDSCERDKAPVDKLLTLLTKTEEDDVSYLETKSSLDDSLIKTVLDFQSGVMKAKMRKGDLYEEGDLKRLWSLLQQWPNDLSTNKNFQSSFMDFWQSNLNWALDYNGITQPAKVLSFLESNPQYFPKENVIRILSSGLDKCLNDVEYTIQQNKKPESKVTMLMHEINLYILKENLQGNPIIQKKLTTDLFKECIAKEQTPVDV